MNGHLSPPLEWLLFISLSLMSIIFAFCMVRTMSMVRAGMYLIASFCALAGLFLVLSADLIASMQIMMYVGSMLVMTVFMVMMSSDPGGSTMGISPPEPGVSNMQQMMKAMSGNLHAQQRMQMMVKQTEGSEPKESSGEYVCLMHHDTRLSQPGRCPRCGMQLQPAKQRAGGGHMGGMMHMTMKHEFKRPAAILGALVTAMLITAILLTSWPAAAPLGRTDSAVVMGQQLMGRYMIAFEGGALLIIVGVVGAVILARREK